MRILYPENPRFPPEGSSAEGKSGPKARLKSVVDGQRVNIPVPLFVDIEGRRRLNWPDIGLPVQTFEAMRNGENILS